jgi:hypothetical protein
MREGRARVLVPLNKRHGPVHLRVRLLRSATVRAWWNGRPAGGIANAKDLVLALDPVDRGVHTLELEAPPGTTFFAMWFKIAPGTPP